MRTLWLASTALLLTAGMACAQNAPAPSPAPTGGLASPLASPAPGASPGSMAPSSNSGAPMSGMSSNGTSGSGMSGNPAPAMTAATPGAAPGKTAQSSPNAPAHHPWHHHWSGAASMPQDASASTYLHIASTAIGHHNAVLADDALSHAETRLLDRSVPQGRVAADNSPAIQSIESARQALKAGNFSQASTDAHQAASASNSM
jgi:hypothetical protein